MINDENKGCGAKGLDLNSGWNWTAINHGWFFSSIISGNFLSGDNPEKINSQIKKTQIIINNLKTEKLSSAQAAIALNNFLNKW